MDRQKGRSPKILFSGSLEDDEDEDVEQRTAKPSSSLFKSRKKLGLRIDDNERPRVKPGLQKLANEDEESDEDDSGAAIKITKSIKAGRSKLVKIVSDKMDIDRDNGNGGGSGGGGSKWADVLKRYETNDESIGGSPVDAPPVIPSSFEIQELKDRKYRAQTDDFDEMKRQQKEEDYDSEHEYKTREGGSDNDMEVDLDTKFSDGRLAVSSNEQRVQNMLRREEIEEALFHAQLSDNEDADVDCDDSVDEQDAEFWNSVGNMDSVGGSRAKTDLVQKMKPPVLGPAPRLAKELASLKQTVADLKGDYETQKQKLDDLLQKSKQIEAQKTQLIEKLHSLV